MKKFLSLAITLCLLMASLSAVLVMSASADGTDTTTVTSFGDSYFENTDIWTAQTMNSHVWKDTSDTSIATVQSTTTHGSAQALKLTGDNWVYHKATLPALEQYTTYTLRFEYCAVGGSYPGGATDIVRRMGIFLKDDTTKLSDGTWNIGGGQNGYLNFITETSSFITYDGINGKVTDSSRKTTSAAFDTWYSCELVFKTGAFSNNFYFIIEKSTSANGSIYVDNLQLTKGVAAESMVDPAAWMTYTQKGAGDYSANYTATPYTGTNLSAVNRSAITNASGKIPVKATAQDHDGDGTSLKTNAWLTFYATDFYVKPATYYELSFWYYCDTTYSDGRIISTLNLAPHGTNTLLAKADAAATGYTYDAEGNKITLASLGMQNVKSAGWHKLIVPFYSGANDVLTVDFTNVCSSTNAYPVYLDEFNLQEVLPANYSENWKVTAMPNTSETKYYNTCTDVTDTNTSVSESTTVCNTELDTAPIGLKVDAYAQYAFTEMTVEPKQYYDLEFYYYTDATDSAALGDNRMFSYVAVAEPDAKINQAALGNLAFVGDANTIGDTEYNGYIVKGGNYVGNSLQLTNGLQTWHKITLSFYSADNTSVIFSVRSTVAESYTAYAYLDGISLTKANMQTSYNSKAAIRAASNTDGSISTNGLRTYNAIQSDWLDSAEGDIVEFGSIAIRQGYMEKKFPAKSAPDLDILSLVGKGVGLGVSYRSAATLTGTETVASTLWENDNTDGVFAADIFTSYLTGIDAANYGEEYLVRAYAIDAAGNVYYGDTASVSIFKVAQAISAENDTTKTIDQAAFEAFVGGQQAAYNDWCTANGLAVGDLYTALYAE